MRFEEMEAVTYRWITAECAAVESVVFAAKICVGVTALDHYRAHTVCFRDSDQLMKRRLCDSVGGVLRMPWQVLVDKRIPRSFEVHVDDRYVEVIWRPRKEA